MKTAILACVVALVAACGDEQPEAADSAQAAPDSSTRPGAGLKGAACRQDVPTSCAVGLTCQAVACGFVCEP